MTPTPSHAARTIALCALLHAFTHIYHVALMPLYLPIQSDFQLASVGGATLLVTVMMASYFIPSYWMGILADGFSRTRLLALGLAINGLGYISLSFAPNYPTALLCVALAGFGGSFFHPAATAMIARLYPHGTGRALGWVGVGASVGFFAGPIYSGWRAEHAGWRAPVLELGVAGVIAAGLFAWLAEPQPTEPRESSAAPVRMFPTSALWRLFLGAALLFGLRDFAGSSMGSLGSLFLQKAHGFSFERTGLALGMIFLASAISNPLFGHFSDRGRIRWTLIVLTLAAFVVGVFPRLPTIWLMPALALYGFFFMASYPMVEAALMESVPDAVRGRVFGLFITIGGLVGNLSHWLVGVWVKDLGPNAQTASAYSPIYLTLAILLLLSLLGLPCLRGIRNREASPTLAPAVAPNPQFE